MSAPPEWLEVALPEPCRYYTGAGHCGAVPTRLYPHGRRCWKHAPVAITTTRKEDRRG